MINLNLPKILSSYYVISVISNIYKLCIMLSDRNGLKAVFSQTDYYGLTCEHMAGSIILRQTKVKD